MSGRSNKLSVEEKHLLYEQAVQSVDADIEFIEKEFKNLRKRDPRSLREDFGGTGYLSCEWVKRHSDNNAWAIDLDPEPVNYGKNRHYKTLNEEQSQRMKYIMGNVLDNQNFKSDVIVAFNFSYFIFKKRAQLVEYFSKVREGLKDDGLFFIDLFGGTECCQEMEEETDHVDFSYFWDCDDYNPITGEVMYYIHFEKGGKKYEKVFTYDWRMWGLAELRDILQDAGFSETIAYWEGDDDDGTGDGNFYQADNEENCESWVTYIIAKP